MLGNLKLRGRILAGYSVPVALVAVLGGFVTLNANNVKNAFNKVEDLQVKTLNTANLRASVLRTGLAVRGYLVNNDENALKTFDADWKKIEELLDTLSKSADGDDKVLLDNMIRLAKEYQPFTREVIGLTAQGKQKEALALYNTGTGAKILAEYQENLAKFFDQTKADLEGLSKQANGSINALLTVILIGVLLTIVSSIAIAYLVSGGIAKSVREASTAIASSASEIAATVEQQERTIVQQSASVNETTTTVEELGASSRQSAEQADTSAAGAKQALSVTEDGLRAVEQTTEGLNNLKDKVRAIAEQIMRLSEQTGQISGVTAVVADIANQTNMLALNAAVEAARAGEQGKGFAVVASEIRKLADESKKSAERIYQLVSDVQAAMNSTVMVTDEGTKTADASIRLAQGTADAFNSVSEAINSVFLNNQQIALGSKQQAVGVQQVVSAMNAINLGSKETASGISQVKVSATNLNAVAKNLQAMA